MRIKIFFICLILLLVFQDVSAMEYGKKSRTVNPAEYAYAFSKKEVNEILLTHLKTLEKIPSGEIIFWKNYKEEEYVYDYWGYEGGITIKIIEDIEEE